MLTRLIATCIILSAATPSVHSEILAPGEYPGIVVFDRWDSCLLSNGPYIMWVSEGIKDRMRPFEGRLLNVNAKAVNQPINPGDGCITKFGSPWSTSPPETDPSFRLSVTPEFKPSGPATLLVSLENTSNVDVDGYSEIGFTLLMKKPDRPDFVSSFSPSDGPAFALISRQSLIEGNGPESFDGVTESIGYTRRMTNRLPRRLTLAPGMKHTVRVELSLPPGEFEFLAGSRGSGQWAVTNRVPFDVSDDGGAKTVSADEIQRRQWDLIVDRLIKGYSSIEEPKPVAFPEMGERIRTLFRSHPLSHVQIHVQRNCEDRELTTDLYYGQGELHLVQHVEGWNLVTKGRNAYEWKHGSRFGEINSAPTQELISYAIYLTDPAYFPTTLHETWLTQPERFKSSQAGENGYQRLRLTKPLGGMTELEIDLKRTWYGSFEFKNAKSSETVRYIYSRPKRIEKIPDDVLNRVKQIRFRRGKNSLRRHRTYL